MKHIYFVILSLWCFSNLFAKEFEFEDILTTIKNNNVKTLEQLLPLLPQEIRSNYTLMHTSRSAQGASLLNPRVIMFTPNAKLIMTFNGEPSQRNYNRLELIQFRNKSKQFDFHFIDFNNGVTISPPNPKQCLGCHSQNPHPIWESYPVWRGAFGGRNDVIYDGPDNTGYDEFAEFEKWRESVTTHPRYKHLTIESEYSDVFPFRRADDRHFIRPNNRLGKLLIRLNAQKISTLVNKSSFFKRYPYTTLSYLLNCSMDRWPRPLSFEKTIQTLFEKRFPTEYPDLYVRFSKITDRNYRKLDFLMERLTSDSPLIDWNLAPEFETNRKRYGVAFESKNELIQDWVGARVLELFAKKDAEIKKYTQMISYRRYFDFINHQPGAAEKTMLPGGVLGLYDSLGLFYDWNKLAFACPDIEKRAYNELN